MKNRKEMIWPEDFINKIICGDNLSVMKKMSDESIDMAITSPPYWGLRDYGFEQIFGGDPDCDHEWQNMILPKKGGNIGNKPLSTRKESTKAAHQNHISNICQKCQAWKGQLGLEPTPELYIDHLTEIFNEAKRILKKEGTFWLNMGDTYSSTRWSDTPSSTGISAKCSDIVLQKEADLPAKCLCMIPERLAWSLIQNGWILRNKIIWHKKNHMPSSTKDRFTNTWEYVFYFVKSQRNYFDLDSIREPYTEPLNRWGGPKIDIPKKTKWKSDDEKAKWAMSVRERQSRPNPAGKNPGDIWIINTQPCPEAHFATFPEKLCKKAIIPGSPENGIVLDPFCGVGTALYVAKESRRRFIGIDIKKEYCEMSEKRLAQGVL